VKGNLLRVELASRSRPIDDLEPTERERELAARDGAPPHRAGDGERRLISVDSEQRELIADLLAVPMGSTTSADDARPNPDASPGRR
jgi:hypothetical protein